MYYCRLESTKVAQSQSKSADFKSRVQLRIALHNADIKEMNMHCRTGVISRQAFVAVCKTLI